MKDKTICPHCGAEISYLDYTASIVHYGSEWGTATLEGAFDESDYEIHDDDTSDIEYRCPECEKELQPEDLIDLDEAIENGIREEEEEEEEEEEITTEDRVNILNKEWLCSD